jgi:formylglycine-generating enzyme required for sulfatase activity
LPRTPTIPVEVPSSETPTTTPTEVLPTKTEAPLLTETQIPPEPTFALTATPLPLVIIDEKTDVEMVLVSAGIFWLGSDNGGIDEKPSNVVELGNFYIDKFEVTNAQYHGCVDSGKCGKPSNSKYFSPAGGKYKDHPVVYVGWQDAIDFCEWREARLPTEAEWEKAARGTNESNYPWGNDWDRESEITTLNFCDISCQLDNASKFFIDHEPITSKVGLYEDGQSLYGAYDMAGNVAEWVGDWYSEVYYGELSGEDDVPYNPTGPKSGDYRVIRGGSWRSTQDEVLTYQRAYEDPEKRYNNYIGFRCAADVTP